MEDREASKKRSDEAWAEIYAQEGLSEDERKIAAYDAARATVKIEGNTRAYYVLRAEAAEAEVARLKGILQCIADGAMSNPRSEVAALAQSALKP